MTSTPVGAVVVGGASGIGAAVAENYRERGVPLSVWDVAGERDVSCDVSDPAQVDAAMAETITAIGVPDEFTVCAGVASSGLLLDIDPAEWDRVLGVNTKGVLLAMRAGAKAMIDVGVKGSIVAVSSVSARLVDRNMGVYCASKAALSMVVQVAAFEWADFGVRVNAVGPGVTQTPMLGRAPSESGWLMHVQERTPLHRLGQPEEIADAIVALHGLGWVTGQVLEVDGGLGIHSPIDAVGDAERAAKAAV
ncbi:MAG: glucose 1-dehydrogenase [Actinomycetia bacterium]|nr:glucose 1-dehydrogenase [Actinomycetes bacterium]